MTTAMVKGEGVKRHEGHEFSFIISDESSLASSGRAIIIFSIFIATHIHRNILTQTKFHQSQESKAITSNFILLVRNAPKGPKLH